MNEDSPHKDKILENLLGNAEYFGIKEIYTKEVLTEILNNAFK